MSDAETLRKLNDMLLARPHANVDITVDTVEMNGVRVKLLTFQQDATTITMTMTKDQARQMGRQLRSY